MCSCFCCTDGLFWLDAAKEHVVGWYSTGPKLKENDLDVHALFNKYDMILLYNHMSCNNLGALFLFTHSYSI
jgi:hypothetical protein